MGTFRSLVLRIVIVGALILSIPVILIELVVGSMCGNHSVRDFTSPDNRYTARLRERSCGATTAGTTAIELWDRQAGPELLVKNRRYVFVTEGILLGEFGVAWEGPRRLRITSPRPPTGEVVTSWRDVDIVMPNLVQP